MIVKGLYVYTPHARTAHAPAPPQKHTHNTQKLRLLFALLQTQSTHTARPRTDRAQLPTWLALALDASSRSYHNPNKS